MSNALSWSLLDPENTHKFLNAARDSTLEILFRDDLCEVHTLPLDFYEGYCLYRIVNKFMAPSFTMDFLSNGEDHYYMDGSEVPFQKLNARYAISLDENNVAHYLDFYISYVYERGNSLEFDQDTHEKTKFISQDNGYNLEANVIYQGGKVKADIHVHNDGRIDVRAPVRASFLTAADNVERPSYKHPSSDQISEQIRDIFSLSEKGQDFNAQIDAQNINIQVLNSIDYQGLALSSSQIYITMPAVERNAKYTQALIASFYIREAFQLKDNFFRPHHTEDKDVYLNINYTKNLDMLLESFIMVEELDNAGKKEILNAVDLMGFRPLYEMQKHDENLNNLRECYLECIKTIR